MKLASRSAMESLSSANWSLNESSTVGPSNPLDCEFRKDDREEGRRGVVGRDTGERDRVRDIGRVWEAERCCDILEET